MGKKASHKRHKKPKYTQQTNLFNLVIIAHDDASNCLRRVRYHCVAWVVRLEWFVYSHYLNRTSCAIIIQ